MTDPVNELLTGWGEAEYAAQLNAPGESEVRKSSSLFFMQGRKRNVKIQGFIYEI